MGRLIIVSNRVNPPADPNVATSGGLATALSAALRDHSGIWFGWSGQTVEEYTGQLSIGRVGEVTVATVDLDEQDHQEYYYGYANRTLWPLFHYRMDLTAYERSFDAGYERVNVRFAEALRPLVEPDDLVWVQDYHLMLLARALRERGVSQNRIGFFLHIPWPAPRIFETLPRHRDLIRALLDYDLIGFQAHDHRDAFADYILRSVGGAVDGDTVTAFGKTARIGVFPIGIDAQGFQAAAAAPRAVEHHRRMVESAAGRKLILGVDRLDYSKGLEERFLAYEQLLADHAYLHGEVFLLQIATPSREAVESYQDLRARLDTLSGRINGAFATVDWVPLRYVNRAYRRDALAGIYRAADVGLVMPLRDGMNLVAKEYVAAQDPDDPGVLVLSEYAGAAERMPTALITNPMSREDVAETIRRALAMPVDERKERWQALNDEVCGNDVKAWREGFVAALQATDAR